MKDSAKDRVAQFIRERDYAYKSRQSRMVHWTQNEDSYNGVVQKTLLTKANIHVPKTFEAVQDMSARLGMFPEIDFDTKPEGDENASDLMKHLFLYDAARYDLDYLWELSKIEGGLYGRPIFELIPHEDGVEFQLVDVMAFLIDALATTPKKARYLGRQFIYKTPDELSEDADTFGYDKKEIKRAVKLASDTFNANNSERSTLNQRLSSLGYDTVTIAGSPVVNVTEWYTHIGKEKYLLTIAEDMFLLRAVKLSELGLKEFPFCSRGMYPRNVAFWNPSVADIYRDPNKAMDVIANQQLDNNTYRNFGMIFVDSASGISQSVLVPRPLGVQKVTTGTKTVKDSVLPYVPPEITQGQFMSSSIEGQADNASGLGFPIPTGKTKMSASQLQLETALVEQRLNGIKENSRLLARDIAQMYSDMIKSNMSTGRNVKVYGRQEMTVSNVTMDNFRNVDFIAKATFKDAAQQNKALNRKSWSELYGLLKDDPKVPGQVKLREYLMREFDVPDERINEILAGQPQQPQPQPQPQPNQTQPQSAGTPTNVPESPMTSSIQQAIQGNIPQAGENAGNGKKATL